MTIISSSTLSESVIADHLLQDEATTDKFGLPGFPNLEPPKPAAVLVPLIRNPNINTNPGWQILYTRRTELVQDHKGQVSFPGGRADAGDSSPVATALREAYEEIGLQPSDVKVLGLMRPFLTITNYLVTPVIGTIPWPYQFTLQPSEVSRVFTIPMDWMAQPDHYIIKQRELPPQLHLPSEFHNIQVIYFNEYDGEMLWGVTAEVTLRFLRMLGLG